MLFRILFRNLHWNSGLDSGVRSPRRLAARRPLSPRRAIRPQPFVPWLEALEDRTVLSTLTVTRAADDGSAGTLRAVLAAA
jgi:hypothetical protein